MSSAPVNVLQPRSKGPHVERRVDVEGTPVRYIEGGLSNPGAPVVLLHGLQSGADMWYPYTFPMLAATHRVLALDLPGFGYSGRLATYSADSYAHFVHAFLDALGLDRIDLVGHSMGGQIAIATAAARPERIRRLVLVASAGLPRHTSRWFGPVAVLTDRSTYHVRLYLTMLRLTRHARAMRECYHMVLEDSVFGLLSDLTMPTLIIWGSRDRLVPLEDATLLARGIPNSRLAIMRGCGHLPFYQKPRQFDRLIQKFLSTTLEEGTINDADHD